MISIRRVSLGGGYRYLMQSVAAGDEATPRPEGLTAYYAASGTPPGRFLGAGLADLDGGRGVEKGAEVSEEHLYRMLVELADPVSGEPLGGAPKAPSAGSVPVAGVDLTFNPHLCRHRHNGAYAESRIMPKRALISFRAQDPCRALLGIITGPRGRPAAGPMVGSGRGRSPAAPPEPTRAP